MERTLAAVLSGAIQAYKTCVERGNHEWENTWKQQIRWFERNHLPHGSGIDSGAEIDIDKSHAEKLVIHTGFHHMNTDGYYDVWTYHTIIVTPSFTGVNLRITGPNRNDIKEYLHAVFHEALSRVITDEEILKSRKD